MKELFKKRLKGRNYIIANKLVFPEFDLIDNVYEEIMWDIIYVGFKIKMYY